MSKLPLILFVTLFVFRSGAQVVFCPPGAQWNYNFNTNIIRLIANEKVKYERDSVLNGEQVKVVTHYKFFLNQNCRGARITLFKQKDDTIFMRNERTGHNWQILYNFGAKVGDSWQNTFSTYLNMTVSYTTTVLSHTTSNYFGGALKTMYVRYDYQLYNNFYTSNAFITERIGSSPFLFNYDNVKCSSDFDEFAGFLCYQDNEFGLYQAGNKSCDYHDIMSINESKRIMLRISPNPATEHLNIEAENGVLDEKSNLQIYDLTGRLLSSEHANSINNRIDIKRLESGVYFLAIIYEGQQLAIHKFVKE